MSSRRSSPTGTSIFLTPNVLFPAAVVLKLNHQAFNVAFCLLARFRRRGRISIVSSRQRWQWRVWASAAAIAGTIAWGNAAWGQIQSDNTLSGERSVVTSPNGLNFQIDGGATRGTNLFHSFAQFSVPTGGSALFNAANIQNIFSRVTGGSISNIDGLIRANGNANLFLLNPNGIIFGPNASLKIGGSFLASTASAIAFADGSQFSAIAPQTSALLTINVPIGLQFGANPGGIVVQGDGQGGRDLSDLTDTDKGLHVNANRTLALVGGEVDLEGATLKTYGGRIELGSVAGNGSVSITPTSKGLALGYNAVPFGDIQLSQQADVDASGLSGGDVQVVGRRVTLTGGSQIEASTLGSGVGGSLVVRAQDSLQLIGTTADGQAGSALYVEVYPTVTGTGGDLTIDTNMLLLQDGSQVDALTFGPGNAGSLTVNATREVQLIGSTANSKYSSGFFTDVERRTSGKAGDLTINTGMLLVQDGAQVAAGTFGPGNGGNLTVNASEGVQLIGITADGQHPSGLYTQADRVASGNAGDLTINTGTLLVRDGAKVSAGTLGSGNGGNLTVNAAREVQLIGAADGQHPSSLVAEARLDTSGNAGNLTGNAGNLTIHTPSLLVRDGATITARSQGQGLAGNLLLQADSILLDNRASLSANTTSNRPGNQANIILNVKDLLLRHNSNITTNAQGSNVIGGNITINTDNLVAVPKENSDISANATGSFGGRIIINAKGIFGTQFRLQPTPLSDITASSALGPQFNGIVQINTPGTDPSRGLTVLPTTIADASKAIADSCAARRYRPKSSFIITGATGLPPQPDDSITAPFPTYVVPTIASRNVGQTEGMTQSASAQNYKRAADVVTPVPAPLEEAQGWIVGPHGEIILTATAPTIPSNVWRCK